MCDKSYEDPRDVVHNSACEIGVIASMLKNSQSNSDILGGIFPHHLGILLSGVQDRLTAAFTALNMPPYTRPPGSD